MTATPIAVGTQGTVGSLVRKEIEYFSSQRRSEKRPQAQSLEMASDSGHHCKSQNSKPGFWFLGLSWRRKKPRVAGGFQSTVYAAPDALGVHRSNSIRGFNYVSLKDEFNNLQSY
ncbi:hypothetical protein SAY86_004640 [Trapa natans]|uniref:Uncharacterized protein n=1 Tax=Trapa natans TaxID=22666 RepID=A0AAN7M827_TRANT|nr:hypothetical protein SAY86_004640 [Trapa natans]